MSRLVSVGHVPASSIGLLVLHSLGPLLDVLPHALERLCMCRWFGQADSRPSNPDYFRVHAISS